MLSPSTRHIDLGLKRSADEAAGCPSYWVIDPVAPSIRCWELGDEGTYAEVAGAVGDERAHLSAPYDVAITPRALIR